MILIRDWIMKVKNEENDFMVVSNEESTVNTILIWIRRNLETSYNQETTKIILKAIKKANNSEAIRDVKVLAMQTITILHLEMDNQKHFMKHGIIQIKNRMN